MSEGEEAILLRQPEVVPGVILVVMRIDNDLGTERVQQFQKFISTVSEPCIDQQSIYKKGINLEKRDPQEPTGHPDGNDRTLLI
jgi:hypothetical protein